MARVAAFLDVGKSLERATDRAGLAESLGYDSAWVTHIAAREPLQVLAHFAARTERIGLGTGIVPIHLRHPALMAMEAATLHEISGGRLLLGMGVSHRVTVEGWYGLSLDDPVGRMREYTTIVRQLLDTGTTSHEGEHYTARFGFMGFQPPGGVKLFFAALAPKMLRLAAELADGIILWMCSPGYIRDTIRPTIEEGLKEHGRSPADFDIIAAVPVGLSENPAAGRDAFRKRAFPYFQLPFYRKAIAAGGHADALQAFDAAVATGTGDVLAAIPDEVCEDYAALGDAETLRAKIEEYRSAGVTLPAVGPITRHEGALGVEATLEAVAPGAA
jgi:alkanesulfonate monooxygenase SsuD/methylene tetrahydromethanopterin reductase-like flavin-dependent oxidoreductase (luciferase family)